MDLNIQELMQPQISKNIGNIQQAIKNSHFLVEKEVE